MKTTAHCLDCDWTDDSDKADLGARKHGKATGHATTVVVVP